MKADTAIIHLTDQVAKVHSASNLNGCRTSFNFTLPDNTIRWSYYVGVDQAGQQAYENATAQLTKYAAPCLLKMPGYCPIAVVTPGFSSYIT